MICSADLYGGTTLLFRQVEDGLMSGYEELKADIGDGTRRVMAWVEDLTKRDGQDQ